MINRLIAASAFGLLALSSGSGRNASRCRAVGTCRIVR
jgi:hypothetical protein